MRYQLRILTNTDSKSTEIALKKELTMLLFPFQVQFQPMIPYWKTDGWGEMHLSVVATDEKDEVYLKQRLSTNWMNDVTDSRWATIHLEAATFIWMSQEAG